MCSLHSPAAKSHLLEVHGKPPPEVLQATLAWARLEEELRERLRSVSAPGFETVKTHTSKLKYMICYVIASLIWHLPAIYCQGISRPWKRT